MTTIQTALITGASNGTGYEVAKLLAKDGLRLIIVSNKEKNLQHAATEFLSLGATDVIIIQKDLAQPGASADIYAYTKKHHINIDLLINDSGIEEFNPSSETDIKKKLVLIQLNIASMVYLYLNDMLPENKGHILQLASVALHHPSLYLTAYTESKAFVLSFTSALADELRNENITIAGIVPEQILFSNTTADTFSKHHHVLSAKAGYDAIMKGLNYSIVQGLQSRVILSNALLN